MRPGPTGAAANASHLEEIPTVTSIVFNFPLILHNQFVDLALVCLHLRNPFDSDTWFRLRRTQGEPQMMFSLG
jgi:hypothetical protein